MRVVCYVLMFEVLRSDRAKDSHGCGNEALHTRSMKAKDGFCR